MASYFLPPVSTRTVPPERVPEVTSVRYRGLFLNTWAGEDVTIGEVTYAGGRWNGPLSVAEVAAITAAGYAARIAEVSDPANLPVLDA